MTPTGLPIDACLGALRAVLADRGDAVLVAPPGSGKTTVVPLALRHEPWVGGGRIMVLEPRRLATRAAACRMAAMLGEEVGATVGYRTRDERRVSAATRIEVVTEGVLTRRLQRDPTLAGVVAVLFDEVHERNLQTDIGLAFCLDTRAHLRPDLRLLAMSATLDADLFAALIGRLRPGDDITPSAVITVDAVPHPIECRWLPRQAKDRLEPAVVQATSRALIEEHGDVLVFLPGAAEITRTVGLLESTLAGTSVDVYPLYGALTLADQDRALAPSPPGRRRIVVATDIAETSLTVEGVRVVVDGGVARVPRYDVRTGLTRLRTVGASRSSADQRAGRAGRLGPGAVYRLWSKGEHATRPRTLAAEITQVDLAGFVLEVRCWGSPIESLGFLDAPPAKSIADATSLLTMLGALQEGRVTSIGQAMSSLPVHPRLARMLVGCRDNDPDLLWTACVLATLVDERDVLRGRPDELPADVAARLRLIDGDEYHPLADARSLRSVRQRARELARRLDCRGGVLRDDAAGRLLAMAYPDRVAIARSQPGRFQLRSGTGAWVPSSDVLAHERFIIGADLDGDRREARVRLGAGIHSGDVAALFADQLEERVTTDWDRERDELVERVERRLGGMVLDVVTRRPESNDAVIATLVARVRGGGLDELPWTPQSRQFRSRVRFLVGRFGDPWPDWSDEQMLVELDDWLPPFLIGARGRDALDRLDVMAMLRSRLDPRLPADADRLAPPAIALAHGRRVELDYGDGSSPPTMAVRVQELFGSKQHPTVCGGAVPVLLHLLSPAGRPVQITSDLPGFWAGSWVAVRKEMAGRYPKHSWPVDPANATPPAGGPPRGKRR